VISRERKALLHVAKAKLALDDGDYRALLQRVARVSSSTQLSDESFDQVMAEFERLGFRSIQSSSLGTRREGMATPAQVGRIRALWKAYSGNDDDLRLGKWLQKHFHVANVRFLEDARASKAIGVLEKMAAWARDRRSA
jgi:hypothetical protein